MRTISISRPTFKGALWTLYAAALLNPVSGLAQRNAPPQNVVVDTTPSHAVSSFSPFRSLGAGIDRLRGGVTDEVMTPEFIQKIQSAGWQTVSYRQNTELFAEAWHWNPKGKWSNARAKEGYFVGDEVPGEMIRHSWAAPLPHRGFSNGDGDGYSRLTDGDPNTYWKSNPYLTKPFTGEDDHPQWVTLDLGSKLEINAMRIAWSAPYATKYRVQFWTGDRDPFNAPASGIWQTLGFAIAELYAGTLSGDGEFHDILKHVPNRQQSITQCSSVDPWHAETDMTEASGDQVGFDLFYTSGVTRGLPAMIPVALLYSTPEDAAAQISYIKTRGYPISYVEMGEEADGQHMLPEDYGALYIQFAASIHKVFVSLLRALSIRIVQHLVERPLPGARAYRPHHPDL